MSTLAGLANLVTSFAAKNLKAVGIGLLLMPVYFYAVTAIFGVNPKTHLDFLSGNDPYIERYKLVASHLDAVNKDVDDFERASHAKQLELFKLFDKNILDESEKAKALAIVNRNQDIVRALMDFGKYHSVLVSTEQSNAETQKILQQMYTGYLNIIKADKDPGLIQSAYNNVKEIFNDLTEIPMPLRNEVKMELLSYLAYLAFRQKDFDAQQDYTHQAEVISELTDMNAVRYRRKFYWVDLSHFMTAVNSLDTVNADTTFNILRSALNDNQFLRAKLLQHSAKLDESDKVFLAKYIQKIL